MDTKIPLSSAAAPKRPTGETHAPPISTPELHTFGIGSQIPAGSAAEGSASSAFLADAKAAAQAANGFLNGLADAAGVTPLVEKHPYGVLAAAVGAGYVAAGGLFTPTSARLVGMALKLAAIPAVRDRLLDAAESAVDTFLVPPQNS